MFKHTLASGEVEIPTPEVDRLLAVVNGQTAGDKTQAAERLRYVAQEQASPKFETGVGNLRLEVDLMSLRYGINVLRVATDKDGAETLEVVKEQNVPVQ